MSLTTIERRILETVLENEGRFTVNHISGIYGREHVTKLIDEHYMTVGPGDPSIAKLFLTSKGEREF